MEPASDRLPRTYVIKRSKHLGYGFVAGYESPTQVKIIEPNGPSYKHLLQGDIIMAVNGIDVESASREQIIKMIQLCRDQITIKVRQPTYEELIRAKNLAQDLNTRTFVRNQAANYGRHSPSPQRCKSSVDNTHMDDQPLLKRSNTMRPIKTMPQVLEILKNVIRVFFEDGHTRVLNHNADTTVGSILETLNSRTCAASRRYFGLVLTVEQAQKEKKSFYYLKETDSISKIRQLPYARKLRLLYRMVHPPSDVSSLYAQDKVSFEYLYQQSCNDLKYERFSPELDQNTVLKLCALHLLEYVHSNHSKAVANSKDPKVFLKLVKKSLGIKYFLPSSLAEAIEGREGKKMASQYKKMIAEHMRENFEEFDFEPPKVRSTMNLNRYSSSSFHELSLPEMRSSPSEYIKLLFLNYLSQFPCYNGGATEQPSYDSKEVDMAQTPSIESVSSITFNIQSTPSPQHPLPQSDLYPSMTNTTTSRSEPSPKPRQQRPMFNQKSIDELLRKATLPQPPESSMIFNNRFYPSGFRVDLTRVLSDKEIEKLRVPPPPRMIN